MKLPRHSLPLLAALWLVPLAQAGETAGSRAGIAPPKRIPDVLEPQTLPAGEPVATAGIPKAVRRAVVADAARRFDVQENSVVLARAERVTWSDGSLGCPTAGRYYTQALVPGFRVTATTASGEMRYHTDERGNVATCGALPRARALSEAPAASDGDQPRTQPPVRVNPDR
jgi:hypothetical protein